MPVSTIVKDVLQYLNEARQTVRGLEGTRGFQPTPTYSKHIIARLHEGFQPSDFVTVIDNKVRDWGREPAPGKTDMRKFLRPQTLFTPANFQAYLNE